MFLIGNSEPSSPRSSASTSVKWGHEGVSLYRVAGLQDRGAKVWTGPGTQWEAAPSPALPGEKGGFQEGLGFIGSLGRWK